MDLEAIGACLAQRRPGHALPQGLYSAQAAYEFDQAAIFGRTWILAGFEAELPKAGSWLSLMVGSAPVLGDSVVFIMRGGFDVGPNALIRFT